MKIHFSQLSHFVQTLSRSQEEPSSITEIQYFACGPYLPMYFATPWGFFKKMQWGVRSERCHLKSERIRNVNACCRTAELHHPFPSHHPIHYASWTVSSKLKVTLWWAPPSRVWCMCACVCEMDWRALKEGRLLCSCCRIRHTHTHCRDVGQN